MNPHIVIRYHAELLGVFLHLEVDFSFKLVRRFDYQKREAQTPLFLVTLIAIYQGLYVF